MSLLHVTEKDLMAAAAFLYVRIATSISLHSHCRQHFATFELPSWSSCTCGVPSCDATVALDRVRFYHMSIVSLRFVKRYVNLLCIPLDWESNKLIAVCVSQNVVLVLQFLCVCILIALLSRRFYFSKGVWWFVREFVYDLLLWWHVSMIGRKIEHILSLLLQDMAAHCVPAKPIRSCHTRRW